MDEEIFVESGIFYYRCQFNKDLSIFIPFEFSNETFYKIELISPTIFAEDVKKREIGIAVFEMYIEKENVAYDFYYKEKAKNLLEKVKVFLKRWQKDNNIF